MTTTMTIDWDEEWLVGSWIHHCRRKPQSVPEEHRAAFEAAVERSGYAQVRAARRLRGHTATSGGRGSPGGRVSSCSWALSPVCVHALWCRRRHSLTRWQRWSGGATSTALRRG